MESIGCIFCKNEEQDCPVVIEENGFSGRKCPACGLLFISPRPSSGDIRDLYGHAQAHVTPEAHLKKIMGLITYVRYMLSRLKCYQNNGALLEIGPGGGNFLKEAKRSGFEVHGIELNGTQCDYIKNSLGIPCESKPVSDCYADRKFKVLYHCDVISHLYDPFAEIKEMNRKLEEGGILIFETGNLGDVEQKYYSLFARFQYPDHLFFFSERNLKDLLEKTGFEILEIHRYSILVQLRIISWVRGIANKILGSGWQKKEPSAEDSAAAKSPPSTRKKTGASILIEIINAGLQLVLHLSRYPLGGLLPKKGRPQTLILIARKLTNRETEPQPKS